MGRWLLIVPRIVGGCGVDRLEVLSRRGDAAVPSSDAGDARADAMADAAEAGNDAGAPVQLGRDLWIHHPFDLDRPDNLGTRFLRPCSNPPMTITATGAGVVGDALVTTSSTAGCQNRNTDEFIPREGGWTVALYFRVDAPAPLGAELEGFSLPQNFELLVDDADQLVLRTGNRGRDVLLAPVSGTGWHAFVIRVVRDPPETEVFLDGERVLRRDDDTGFVGPSNGRTLDWRGAIDELRTYARRLNDAEVAALSDF